MHCPGCARTDNDEGAAFCGGCGAALPVPLRAFEVSGIAETGGRFGVAAARGLTRFVGRDAELDQLVAAWRRARAGEGQVLSVVGEAARGRAGSPTSSRTTWRRVAVMAAVGERRPGTQF
jgi:hypothetical protein